jgi:hypothetical protein
MQKVMADTKITIPFSPYAPYGPVRYRLLENSVDEWNDREKAAYVMSDIQLNGIREIDTDQWVTDLLLRLLWAEINRSAETHG